MTHFMKLLSQLFFILLALNENEKLNKFLE
jgi:hypothetical protein